MNVFYLIILGIPLLSLAYWIWAHWRLRRLGAGAGWHFGVAATMILLVAGYAWVILSRPGLIPPTHPWIYALVLVWALILLPFLAVPMMGGWTILTATKAITRKLVGDDPEVKPPPPPSAPSISRREMIGRTAVALPVIATFGLTAVSIPQKTRFRIRHLAVPVPDLPAALDGIRIAHLSDTHVGKFTRGRVLDQLAEETNRLQADLVLLTGDLIDNSLNDLPDALDMIGRMNPGSGLFTVEGNHDLFEGAEAFASGVRECGIALLRDQSSIIRVRGRPVQIMGTSWHRRGDSIAGLVDRVADQRDPDAFPILLAHHPHAFDRAAERGIPLTLAGHTHGGQIMLTPEIGPGPLMFKYWTGLYQKNAGRQSLVVSNGAGNWFPLRTAAPAEIVHITLHKA
jgi:predicted MPP superfamily phosphohydrolase